MSASYVRNYNINNHIKQLSSNEDSLIQREKKNDTFKKHKYINVKTSYNRNQLPVS